MPVQIPVSVVIDTNFQACEYAQRGEQTIAKIAGCAAAETAADWEEKRRAAVDKQQQALREGAAARIKQLEEEKFRERVSTGNPSLSAHLPGPGLGSRVPGIDLLSFLFHAGEAHETDRERCQTFGYGAPAEGAEAWLCAGGR